jgi:hypothetical protein
MSIFVKMVVSLFCYRPGLAIGQTGQMPDGPDARWAGRRSGELVDTC